MLSDTSIALSQSLQQFEKSTENYVLNKYSFRNLYYLKKKGIFNLINERRGRKTYYKKIFCLTIFICLGMISFIQFSPIVASTQPKSADVEATFNTNLFTFVMNTFYDYFPGYENGSIGFSNVLLQYLD